jgi:subtilase family serine protease
MQHLLSHRVVQYPASDPLVLSVGGTTLSLQDGGRQEIAWAGSGGGVSKIFREPGYQRHLSAGVQRFLHGQRGVPDVAIDGAHQSPVYIYAGGAWRLAAGTSAAAPQWAGIAALADDLAGRKLGDLHGPLYALAGSSRYNVDLYDVTEGTIQDPPSLHSESPLHAARGWDPTTGLGTPRAASLLPDLAGK